MTKFATLDLVNGQLVEKSSFEIDLHSIPSGDPLAFAFGLSKGKYNREHSPLKRKFEDVHGSKYSELAQEYLRGFLLGYKGILVPEGTKIKKGEESCLALFDKNILK